MNIARTKLILIAIATVALAAGCGSDSGGGDGNLTINLEPEETITDGVPDSNSNECEEECITDGYSASFTRYISAVGFVQMSQNGANSQDSSVVGVADWKDTGNMPELFSFNGIPTGQYTEFGYQTPLAESDMVNVTGVDEDLVEQMVTEGLSYIIEGTLTQTSSGDTVDFLIEADVSAFAENCEGGGEGAEPGVNVTTNQDASLTLHGDHIFFNGFPENEEDIERLATWMWTVAENRTTDPNEPLTREDFEAADADALNLFPADQYDFSKSPLAPIDTAWEFIRAQLATQGHLNGDGECEYSLDE
jgi:hypothetical protein